MKTRLKSGISRLAVAVLATSFGGIAATAADMPAYPRKELAPIYSWTGFYFGPHGGKGWVNTHFDDPLFVFANRPFDINSEGVLAGGQLGVNWQVGYFVIGAEADASWASLRGTFLFNPTIAATDTTSHVRAFATGTLRLGFAMGPWLAYAKGGVAWSDVEFSTNLAVPSRVTVEQHRTGLTAGGGLEVAFWRNVSAKLEYNYIHYGPETVTFGSGAGTLRTLDVKMDIHLAKAGFNVRFGGEPISARY